MANVPSSYDGAQALQQQEKDSIISTAAPATAAIAASKLAYDKYGSSESKFSEYYSKILGTRYLDRQLHKNMVWTDTVSKGTFANSSVMKSMLSQLMALEEASPLHILRTLQLSNIINPFIDITQSEQQIKFTTRKIRNQEHYYKAMIEFANRDLEEKLRTAKVEQALQKGMIFLGGKLYGVDSKGNIDINNVIVKSAKLSLANVHQGQIYSPNLMFENYSRTIGAKVDLDALKADNLVVMGARSNAAFSAKWGESWLRFATVTGMKSLDNPLGGFEDMLSSMGLGETGLFKTRAWNFAKKYTNIQMGTNGNYEMGIRRSLYTSGKNVLIKGAALTAGYEIADSVVRTLAPSGSLFDGGIYKGLVNLYASTRVSLAENWSDRFQGYKDSQEQWAPGSTSLTALVALPLSGAILGSQYSYFRRIGKTLVSNSDEAANTFNVAKTSSFLSNLGLKGEYKPMKRNALIGAIAGATLALPFLPGALIGSSSEELKELYNGDKEVAQRANRWWLFGGNKWDGSHVTSFQKHAVARENSNAKDIVRYGDDDTEKKLNPFLHPFAYLRNPYRYEQMHQEDMPYPVWGLDMNYGSIYGKLFERTIGQIIKPDVINPALMDMRNSLIAAGKNGESYKEGIAKGVVNFLFNSDKDKNGLPVGELSTPVYVNAQDQSLIKQGMLIAPPSGNYDPNLEGAGLTYQAATDLVGLKGWTLSLPVSELGIGPEYLRQQLARSGESTSAARDLLDQNVGDLFGFGEFQRKILGTSSGSLPDRLNPLYNNSASWLPSKDSGYYINFAKGNPYSKIDNGEERLAGRGYAALHKELEGVDPEDYGLAYRYKILSDVAKGSREHIRARQQMIMAYKSGDLSQYEEDILQTTLEQEAVRSQKKDFYTPSTGGFNPLGLIQSTLWNAISKHGESPFEMLTPIRPMAKFIHNRTAIQDYVETQLGGSDSAIWTNPYSHFIKPALNKSRLIVDSSFIPEEKREKDNINEYFDKLGHIKNRMSGKSYDTWNSVIASSMSGLNTNDKVLQFKKSLSDEEKDYFESFSKETDQKKRDKIRSILPSDVLRGYEQIWRNVDIANNVKSGKSKYDSVQVAIAEDIHNQTLALQKQFNVSLQSSDKDKAKQMVESGNDNYSNMGFSENQRIRYTEDELLRLKMADRESMSYLNNQTGVPTKKFMGWDPRLKTDDIKIRTLSVGGEDLRRFGFWKSDEERMYRLPILSQDNEVVDNLDKIKRDMRSNIMLKRNIEQTMFSNGFKVKKIDMIDSDYASLQIQGSRE